MKSFFSKNLEKLNFCGQKCPGFHHSCTQVLSQAFKGHFMGTTTYSENQTSICVFLCISSLLDFSEDGIGPQRHKRGRNPFQKAVNFIFQSCPQPDSLGYSSMQANSGKLAMTLFSGVVDGLSLRKGR